jgi:PAS domain S-box-containing protein
MISNVEGERRPERVDGGTVTSRSRDRMVERRVRLDPVPGSARRAREFVNDVLEEAGQPDFADSTTLLVSELVTNAILHARTSIEVAVAATTATVYVGVSDTSEQLPARRDYGTRATTGRGLALVDLIAARHGTETHDDGSKTVWFELGPADDNVHQITGDHDASPDPTAVAITFREMPLRLARVWQQYVAALMREYLLLVWELDGDVDARLFEQALAADALADVAAAFDAAPLPTADDHVDVILELSPQHGERFEGLDRLLEAIMSMDGRDDMLTPRMQPEMRKLRRWICAEVRNQLAGQAPVSWSGFQTGGVDVAARPVDWEVAAVQTSSLAELAADDANRIIAASPSALSLLGWTAAELLGQRLVTVIPPRLREQHIAAFSEHLLTGVQTILDRGITVPALHRNGNEVLIEMVVRRERVAGGRAVFVATMTAAAEG